MSPVHSHRICSTHPGENGKRDSTETENIAWETEKIARQLGAERMHMHTDTRVLPSNRTVESERKRWVCPCSARVCVCVCHLRVYIIYLRIRGMFLSTIFFSCRVCVCVLLLLFHLVSRSGVRLWIDIAENNFRNFFSFFGVWWLCVPVCCSQL